jgi:hypothetical protein
LKNVGAYDREYSVKMKIQIWTEQIIGGPKTKKKLVRVWNLVSDIKGETGTEGISEQGTEDDIWTEEGWGDERMEKIA